MEENKTVFFQGEVTYTQEVLKEYQRACAFLDKNEIMVHMIFLVGLLIFTVLHQYSDITFYGVLFLLVFVLARQYASRNTTAYSRMISQNEGVPLCQTYEFNNYHVLVVQPRTGNQYKFHYTQIINVAQTEHFYVLYLEHRQYMLLEKDKLTGGTGDAFIRFLCGACPNMKPKKLRNSTYGKVIYYVSIVLACLLLLGNVILYLTPVTYF